MQDQGNDIPRLPAEDVVDRSTDIPDVAHDDERLSPDEDAQQDDDTAGDDLDPQMTD
jgi:hypothetical protein